MPMIHHDMRRSEKLLSDEEAKQLLAKGEYGILATVGADGYPYGVPMSYAFEGDTLYFHCAKDVGHKVENICHCANACFTVVGPTKVLPERFSTNFESVIAFGTIQPAQDKHAALMRLVKKYSPDFEESGAKYANASEAKVGVYEMKIEKLTGKANRR